MLLVSPSFVCALITTFAVAVTIAISVAILRTVRTLSRSNQYSGRQRMAGKMEGPAVGGICNVVKLPCSDASAFSLPLSVLARPLLCLIHSFKHDLVS